MLVIPCVSTGNVPQLAVDLLIATFGFELIATLPGQSFHPFAGPLDWPDDGRAAPKQSGITTAVQAFRSGPHTLIQLRTPALASHGRQAVMDIVKWAETNGIDTSDSLIVSSANAGQRLSASVFDSGPDAIEIISAGSPPPEPPLAAAGFVVEARELLPKAPTVVIHTYEGDNIPGAETLAAEIAQRLGLHTERWVRLYSWRRLFGKDIPLGLEQGIYS